MVEFDYLKRCFQMTRRKGTCNEKLWGEIDVTSSVTRNL
jgi:hypothetical protein